MFCRFPGAERVTLLLVSSAEEDHVSLRRILERSDWELRECSSIGEALAMFASDEVGVIVCSTDCETGNWRELLSRLSTASRAPRLILCSRLADDRLWAEALNCGCYDVLLTPFSSEEVLRVAYLAWDSWRQSSARSKPPGQEGKPEPRRRDSGAA